MGQEEKANTSIRVFRKFLVPLEDGSYNAEGIFSSECYNWWISTRKTPPLTPEKSFQRALTSHLCGVDGRLPFTPQEEAAILSVIRQKELWICFPFQTRVLRFRARGFHEKKSISTTSSRSKKQKVAEPVEDDSDELSPLTSGLEDGSKYEAVSRFFLFQKFQDGALAILNQCETKGDTIWHSILDYTRFMAFGQGFIHREDDGSVEAFYRSICDRHPGDAVVVMDLLSKLSERFVFQNEASLHLLGPIARCYPGGCTRKFFDSRDNLKCLAAGIQAFACSGQEVEVVYRIHYPNGTTMWARTWAIMDASKYVCYLRGFVPFKNAEDE